MLTDPLVIGAALVWLGLLFGTALWAERRPALFANHWQIVYSLSLAVYCTSWTFYGTVTQAQRSGWPVPPTFVGTILLYVFAFGFLQRLDRIAREQHSTSVADLIATRIGRSPALAAMVTAVAVLGMVPYIALQLKAVAMSYGMLTRAPTLDRAPWQDSALYVALAMALFAMLFGTRRASAAEHNRGLVLAVAVESLLKLGAMLALGAFVVFGIDLPDASMTASPPIDSSGFPALILLGALAMFTLPHQFHVGVVECRDPRDLRTARWLFPIYMLLIALPILPIARAGDAKLAALGVPSDLYVLALPLSEGHSGLALISFLGGLSAATGMVIIATLALSVMISNHWLAPLLVRGPWSQRVGDLRGAVLLQRRVGILAMVLLAWAYSRAIVGNEALADIGALSFSGLATLAPAVVFAVLRPNTRPLAVSIGLLAAVLVWVWALPLPTLVEGFGADPAWLHTGPLGIAWLAPDALFGLDGWSRVARAVTLSLLCGSGVTMLLAARLRPIAEDALHGTLDRLALRDAAARFLSPERLDELLFAAPGQDRAASPSLVQQVERELSAVLGAGSARFLLEAARRRAGGDLETVASLVDEASQALRFNQRVLEAALENMTQGISVVDGNLDLVAWNRRYAELFDYPQTLLMVGTPVADLVRFNIEHGLGSNRDVGHEVARRIAHMRAGTSYVTERHIGQTVVEIRGNPMPGGGFVATFTDVTAFRRNEDALKQVAATLEQRVAARTAELAGAKAEAESANRAKTRFLAAVSHDLAQPLNAAHLFTYALAQRTEGTELQQAVGNIDGALSSAEGLLGGLLDISRLDAGGLSPKLQAFALDELLRSLAAEFRVVAEAKGLALRNPHSGVWVYSDAQLLRRVLQNFLANAVRYTARGEVLLGVRRRGGSVSIQVHDTGPGIAESDQALIFEEFRRLDRGGPGLGLGLAIAERTARLLGHSIALRSRIGRGTCFSIDVPRVEAGKPAVAQLVADSASPSSRVLVVDNDPEVLLAMHELLAGWGLSVQEARSIAEAMTELAHVTPDILLLDYRLDDGETGLDLLAALADQGRDIPCIVISADHGKDLRRAVRAQGAVLLHKPLKPLALKSAMTQLLAARA